MGHSPRASSQLSALSPSLPHSVLPNPLRRGLNVCFGFGGKRFLKHALCDSRPFQSVRLAPPARAVPIGTSGFPGPESPGFETLGLG